MILEFDPRSAGLARLNGANVIVDQITVETTGPQPFRGIPVDSITHRVVVENTMMGAEITLRIRVEDLRILAEEDREALSQPPKERRLDMQL